MLYEDIKLIWVTNYIKILCIIKSINILKIVVVVVEVEVVVVVVVVVIVEVVEAIAVVLKRWNSKYKEIVK